MAETYVVTGGAGFIGSHLAERLLRDGHRVRVVDNFATGKTQNLDGLQGDLEVFDVSITDREALIKPFAGADYIFHEAALPSVARSVEDPLGTNEVNVTGTLNVLITARDAGVKRVIYAASSSAAVIPLFMSLMLRGQSPVINGDGTQSRDFTYIDNVVHGNMLAARAPKASGRVMNVATGGRIDLLDLVDRLNALLGTAIKPVFGPERSGDIKHSRASIELAGELLGYEPVVDFDEGLARTLAWYRAQVAG
jgi:nucleoside-diphosphate-sugar epimerase